MSEQVFRAKAPWIMALLMADFAPLDEAGAAAILGNFGRESGGLSELQERASSSGRGGWGWAQWTGARREAFEAYCTRHGYDPESDLANYKWLFVELTGPFKAALAAVRRAATLRDKVIAFERTFEKAGVAAYDDRVRWAEIALEAYRAAAKPIALPDWIEGRAPALAGPELAGVSTEALIAEIMRRVGMLP